MDYYIHLIHPKTKNLKHLFNSKNRFFMRKSIIPKIRKQSQWQSQLQ